MGSLNLPHLVPRKRPRIEDGHDVAAASAPTPLRAGAPLSKVKGLEGPAQSQRSGGRLAFDERRGSPVAGGSRGDEGSSPPAAGVPSVHTRVSNLDFLAVDAPAKRALVEKLAMS